MDGEIGVLSKSGEGSVFWVELPFSLASTATKPRPVLSPHKFVILEQNKTSRAILTAYCTAMGSSLNFADNETHLISLLNQSDQDMPPMIVMLCDTQQDHDYLELARQLRSCHGEKLYLCWLTYLTRIHAVEKQVINPFNTTFTRPLDFDALYNCVQSKVSPSLDEHIDKCSMQSRERRKIRPLNVLIAEDNEINAKIITEFLSKAGHLVEHAENGQQALDKLACKNYDLVFMDMRMPEMNGVAATKIWREKETAGKHVPIVALTANATAEDRKQYLSAGMDDFLTKPVNQEKLYEIIDVLTT